MMKDKRLIALVVLGIAVVVSLIYGITAPSKRRAGTRHRPGELKEGKPRPAEGLVPMRRRAKRTEYTEWGRNPFIPKGMGRPLGLALGGIMWEREKPRAMINKNIVGIGDMVGINRVIDIKRDRVILTDGAKKIVLELKD
jgi:hypothetical protein